MAQGDIPPKNTPEWKRNEKIINQTPVLRAARDQAEGFAPRHNRGGKGDAHRPMSISKQEYAVNWDKIFGKKNND